MENTNILLFLADIRYIPHMDINNEIYCIFQEGQKKIKTAKIDYFKKINKLDNHLDYKEYSSTITNELKKRENINSSIKDEIATNLLKLTCSTPNDTNQMIAKYITDAMLFADTYYTIENIIRLLFLMEKENIFIKNSEIYRNFNILYNESNRKYA